MAAKVFTVAVVAVCLIQGHHCLSLGSIRNFGIGAIRNVVSAGSNGALNAVNGVQNVAQNAAGAVQNAAQFAVNAAGSSIDNAQNLASSLTNGVSNVNPLEILQAVQSVQQDIVDKAQSAGNLVENAINNVPAFAEDIVGQTVAGWNTDVSAIVKKANELGVDVRQCATDRVLNLGKSTARRAVKCVTDKINEAKELVRNIINLVPESANLVKGARAGVKTCQETGKNIFSTGVCSAKTMAPIVGKAAVLGKNAVTYYSRATILVTTIKEQLIQCATKVVATKAVEAAGLGLQITSCVADKIKASS